MKILITGGAGFIGSWLGESLLVAGHDVVVLDNLSGQIHGQNDVGDDYPLPVEGIRFIRGDVTKIEDWHKALDRVDVVIHLAAETGTAQSMYQIAHYNSVNSQGTALLFEAIADGDYPVKKVVLGSSRSVYGEGSYLCDCELAISTVFTPHPRTAEALVAGAWEPVCPFCGNPAHVTATSENAKIHPASIYAATKYAQEDIVRIGCDALGISSVILRLQNVYGERQSLNNPYTGILSIFSTRIRHGLDLPVFEDGLESRDFVHVSDVVQALELAIFSDVPNGRVFNVGSGTATSVLDLTRALINKFGSDVEPRITAEYRLGDIRHCYADLTRVANELDYNTSVSLDGGLDRFVNWVMSQPLPGDKLDEANDELRQRGLMASS